jgi:REP-associated tyrosine transposase
MSRPLRIEYPGAVYHIINRGNHQERIFSCDDDYRLFLKKLLLFAELFDIEIYAYCLMSNHFHLQLKTRQANLSRFMQSFLTSFTLSINKKHNKSGHLFQGRFSSQLVESELYKNKLSRYIHLNPVKTSATESLVLLKRQKLLIECQWSSYIYYIGLKKKPVWLNRQYVLKSWGDTIENQVKNYRQYVEQGLSTDNMKELSQNTLHNIIGSDSFRDRVIRKYLVLKNPKVDSREQPELATLKSISFKTVIEVVKSYYKIQDTEQILIRKQCHRKARKIAIFFASEYCRRTISLSQIAAKFNIKISGMNTAKDNLSNAILTDKNLKCELQSIRNKIEKRKTEV